MTDIAIRVDNLSKLYHLGALHQRPDTLRDALTGWMPRISQITRIGKKKNPSNPSNPWQAPHSDDLWALKDVSFEVKRGEVVGIIGRNGAGKSTLLKILSRITEPTSGRAEIRGRVGSLLEVGTGFHPELTGRENIFLNGAILGMRRHEIQRRFDEIVAFAEIERFLDTPVKRYSSGMYVRLAFAVAAHLEPEILVVDEVLAVGDQVFQKKCLGRMSEVGRSGRTVLFVSHNMAAIENLCSYAILLDQGKTVASGKTMEIIDRYLQLNNDFSRSAASSEIMGPGMKVLFCGPIDLEGLPLQYVRCGDDLHLAVTVLSYAFVPNAIVSVGLMNHYDIRVAALHSGISGHTLSLKEGENTVVCHVDGFSLMPGTYSLDLAIVAEDKPIVSAPMLVKLTVESADFYGTGKLPDASWAGFTLLSQRWHVHNHNRQRYAADKIDTGTI